MHRSPSTDLRAPTALSGRKLLICLGAALALSGCSTFSSSPTIAGSLPFTAQLKGLNEVPPVGTNATGQLEARLDTASQVLRWKLSYAALSGPATAAHIHGPAPMGVNAGVLIPFPEGATSPVEGSLSLSPEQVSQLQSGSWYVNVHTAAWPQGEIRGQIITWR